MRVIIKRGPTDRVYYTKSKWLFSHYKTNQIFPSANSAVCSALGVVRDLDTDIQAIPIGILSPPHKLSSVMIAQNECAWCLDYLLSH